jgi:hypothetical protein
MSEWPANPSHASGHYDVEDAWLEVMAMFCAQFPKKMLQNVNND